MSIQKYQAISELSLATVRQNNILLLERLVTALGSWKNTSLKKDVRVIELATAAEICAAFLDGMREDMLTEESDILRTIFRSIAKRVTLALSGEAVKFDDAASALQFIITSMKEQNNVLS